jgi:hypothetical protein
LAAGAVFVEEKLAHIKLRRALGTVALSFLLVGGILEAPLCVQMLPFNKLPAYSAAFSFLFRPVRDYNFERSPIPQEHAMRIGWEEMVQKVAEVYNGLPAEDRKKAVIWGSYFTTAGAIDLLGHKYGLPNAVSGHLNYFLWGPGDKPWDVVIAVAPEPHISIMGRFYSTVEKKAYSANSFSMSFNKYYIAVCRNPWNGQTKETTWAGLKYYW